MRHVIPETLEIASSTTFGAFLRIFRLVFHVADNVSCFAVFRKEMKDGYCKTGKRSAG